MKKFIAALALSLAVLTPLAFAADAPTPAKPVIKIGASLPLTGGVADLGESMRDALILAQESLPSDTKFNYELVIEDDSLEAKKAAVVANKLISIDKADAILSFSAGTGAVISPIAERSKVIHIGSALAPKIADGDYNFVHYTPPDEAAREMVEEFKKRNIKSIALFFINQEGGIAIAESIRKKCLENDINIVFEDKMNFGEKDFRTSILKAKATNPDIYVPIAFSPELEIITRQSREAGIEAPLTTVAHFASSPEPQLFEGLWFVDALEPKSYFRRDFENRFKRQPKNFSSFKYDAFNIIVQGFETAAVVPDAMDGKPTPEAVVEAIHNVDMEGLHGKITMDEQGWVFSPATVKIIKNGKPVAIENAL